VEENRLKRCLEGGGGGTGTPGGGWICLSVTGFVTHKHLTGKERFFLSHGSISTNVLTQCLSHTTYYHTKYDTEYVPEM
jgi:hypothetical protein